MSHRPWPEGAKGLLGGSLHTNNTLAQPVPTARTHLRQAPEYKRAEKRQTVHVDLQSTLQPTIPSPPPRLIPVPTPAVGVFRIFQSQKTAPLSGSFNTFGQNLSLPNYCTTFCIYVVKNSKVCFQVHKRLK